MASPFTSARSSSSRSLIRASADGANDVELPLPRIGDEPGLDELQGAVGRTERIACVVDEAADQARPALHELKLAEFLVSRWSATPSRAKNPKARPR